MDVRFLTPAQKSRADFLETARSKNGSFSKSVMAACGASWPPVKFWMARFIIGDEPIDPRNRIFCASVAWISLRDEMRAALEPVCVTCGATDDLQIDHIKPRSKYPELALVKTNLQVLCRPCNLEKGASD